MARRVRSNSRTKRTVRSEGMPRRNFSVTWQGCAERERLASSVRIARVRAALAPGTVAPAAPGGRRAEVEGELASGARHGRDRVTDA